MLFNGITETIDGSSFEMTSSLAFSLVSFSKLVSSFIASMEVSEGCNSLPTRTGTGFSLISTGLSHLMIFKGEYLNINEP